MKNRRRHPGHPGAAGGAGVPAAARPAGLAGTPGPAARGAGPAGAGAGPATAGSGAASAGIEVRTTHKGLILVALMLAMFMTAIEGTIVATAIPSIVADLGGFARFSWVFSAFLLTSAASVPIYGKLADLYGRKPVFLAGAGLFLLGSALCGTASTIGQLVAYRALQGLGAGAVQPITMTIVGDLYRLEERARIQGYLSSVWGVSAVVGPAAGGLLVQYAGWPWVFYINLPIGLLACLGLALFLHEPPRHGRVAVDLAGSFWMVVAVSALLVQLVEGGSAWPWLSGTTAALLALALGAGWMFVRQERRAPEPLLPLELLGRPVIRAGNLGGLVGGIILVGLSSTVPTFVQGVLGRSPVVAGFAVATLSIGWPLASTMSGRLMMRWGFRATAVTGSLFGIAGMLVLWLTGPDGSPLQVAAGCFLVGVSMGLAMTTYIVSIQESVPRHERGVATGSQAFARMLGSAVGAALLGGVINTRLEGALLAAGQPGLARLGADAGNWLLDPQRRAALDPAALEALRQALAGAFRAAMTVVLGLAVLVLPITRTLPRGVEPAAAGRSPAGDR
ncbi:MFS transporter [Thermaerobacter sp. PB12/4term]|uniref:MDR family MFS transporter n=1 Tax=Thermaerobacter sp. PB12/4term TaxID=2293838 RepID=UPI000E32B8A5|nr:MDR family MFS transporter [Thermaerobacter sp. PB12/4term]QIA26537.1 MFS transporter [Thermaerobacter sp. PB12/4term]